MLLAVPLAIFVGGTLLLNKTPTNADQALLPEPTNAESSSLIASPLIPAIQPTLKTSSTAQQQADPESLSSVDGGLISRAGQPLNDQELNLLKAQLATSRDRRLEVLEVFRNSTDFQQSKQLASLLGGFSDPEILQAAAQLTSSGEQQSQMAGLDLLSRLQPHSDQARDLAIELLSAQHNPTLLVATLNALAKPAANATAEQRVLLQSNLNYLASHPDASVRSHSIGLLGRWDQNAATTIDALNAGLNDKDPAVRRAATYASFRVENPPSTMIESLLDIAENSAEKRTVRLAAVRALSNRSLTAAAQRRYRAASVSVNRRSPTD